MPIDNQFDSGPCLTALNTMDTRRSIPFADEIRLTAQIVDLSKSFGVEAFEPRVMFSNTVTAVVGSHSAILVQALGRPVVIESLRIQSERVGGNAVVRLTQLSEPIIGAGLLYQFQDVEGLDVGSDDRAKVRFSGTTATGLLTGGTAPMGATFVRNTDDIPSYLMPVENRIFILPGRSLVIETNAQNRRLDVEVIAGETPALAAVRS